MYLRRARFQNYPDPHGPGNARSNDPSFLGQTVLRMDGGGYVEISRWTSQAACDGSQHPGGPGSGYDDSLGNPMRAPVLNPGPTCEVHEDWDVTNVNAFINELNARFGRLSGTAPGFRSGRLRNPLHGTTQYLVILVYQNPNDAVDDGWATPHGRRVNRERGTVDDRWVFQGRHHQIGA